jgi:NADH pyrophosphatase NudC (nudix superfamily)
MIELDPIALAAVVTCGVGYLMILAGVSKSALEWKRRQRICPSCGRAIKARVCSACGAV